MYHLLSSQEYNVSRHRVAKNAECEFGKLEKWMEKGPHWRAALENNRVEDERNKQARRRPSSWKALGLLSPEGMLAVLIIGYPDPDYRFRDWVGRLQIGWMMTQPRDTLNVQEGFWEGITNSKLPDVFSCVDTEPLKDISLLADYNSLLGDDFQCCRRDIKPYIQAWAGDITLSKPTDTEDLMEELGLDYIYNDVINVDGSSVDVRMDVGLTRDSTDEDLLRTHLLRPTELKDLSELATWLYCELARVPASAQKDELEPMVGWVQHWEERIRLVATYEQQAILRSLFERSLRCLEGLHLAFPELMHAYMILDIEDGAAEGEEDDSFDVIRLGLEKAQALEYLEV